MSSTDKERQLEAELNALRIRSIRKADEAHRKGHQEAIEGLLDMVDDCDRALAQISDSDHQAATYKGVDQLKTKVLNHFEKLGYFVFGAEGDDFDPHRHDAIAVEPGDGADNTLSSVQRLGWEREDGKIVRPAMVTVVKGVNPGDFDPDLVGHNVTPNELQERLEDSLEVARRRRHRRPARSSYVCPYGVPGCVGDCYECMRGSHQ